jgi:hypothetical protein
MRACPAVAGCLPLLRLASTDTMAMTARAKPPKTKGTKIATARYSSKCRV